MTTTIDGAEINILEIEAKRIAELIAKYIQQNITPQEHDLLDEWAGASDGNLRIFEELTDEKRTLLFEGIQFLQNSDSYKKRLGALRSNLKFNYDDPVSVKPSTGSWWYNIVALLILSLSLSVFAILKLSPGKNLYPVAVFENQTQLHNNFTFSSTDDLGIDHYTDIPVDIGNAADQYQTGNQHRTSEKDHLYFTRITEQRNKKFKHRKIDKKLYRNPYSNKLQLTSKLQKGNTEHFKRALLLSLVKKISLTKHLPDGSKDEELNLLTQS